MAAAMDMQRARQQLAAIANLDRSLGEYDIEYWLFGGWAVDFWVGSVSRDHDDIDVAAWQSDKHAVKGSFAQQWVVAYPRPRGGCWNRIPVARHGSRFHEPE